MSKRKPAETAEGVKAQVDALPLEELQRFLRIFPCRENNYFAICHALLEAQARVQHLQNKLRRGKNNDRSGIILTLDAQGKKAKDIAAELRRKGYKITQGNVRTILSRERKRST